MNGATWYGLDVTMVNIVVYVILGCFAVISIVVMYIKPLKKNIRKEGKK